MKKRSAISSTLFCVLHPKNLMINTQNTFLGNNRRSNFLSECVKHNLCCVTEVLKALRGKLKTTWPEMFGHLWYYCLSEYEQSILSFVYFAQILAALTFSNTDDMLNDTTICIIGSRRLQYQCTFVKDKYKEWCDSMSQQQGMWRSLFSII